MTTHAPSTLDALVDAVATTAPAPLPGKAVLELDLRTPLNDQSPHNPLLGLGGGTDSVMSIIATLRRAGTDDRVKGLLVRLPEGGIEPGMIRDGGNPLGPQRGGKGLG